MSLPEQNPDARNDDAGTPGVIDTLGNGFALLSRRPYLVWLPILFDLLIWSGLRIPVSAPDSWIERYSGDWPAAVAELIDQIQQALAGAELVQLMGALTPMLMSDLGPAHVPGLNALSESAVTGDAGVALLILGGVLAVLIGMSYLTMIGRLVTDRPAWGMRMAGDCVANSIRLAGVVVIVIALTALLLIPFLALGAGLYLVGVDISAVLVVLGVLVMTWAVVFFFFSAHAIVVRRAGTFDAMRASYALVHQYLLSVLGLLLLVLVIRLGTPLALQVFTETEWGVPFAIVVNAYVATGLIAATMIYFDNRSRTSFPMPERQSSAGTRR